MESDSIVVMEDGASWPAWVDQEAGQVSNVVILARQPHETIGEFSQRAQIRIDGLTELAAPKRGVLVAGPTTDPGLREARTQLMMALAQVVRRAGGGEVVLVGDDDIELALALRSFVDRLNQRAGTACVELRIRRGDVRRERRVA